MIGDLGEFADFQQWFFAFDDGKSINIGGVGIGSCQVAPLILVLNQHRLFADALTAGAVR